MMLQMLMGMSAGRLVNPLPGKNIAGTTRALLSVGSQGDLKSAIDGGAFTQFGSWYSPNIANGSAFHVRLTKVTGMNLTTGTQNSWLSLTSGQSFGYTGVSLGQIRTGTFTLEISTDGGATVAASSAVGAIEITADNI